MKSSTRVSPTILVFVVSLLVAVLAPPLRAQCPAEPKSLNYSGATVTPCTCFIPGEQAGAVLTVPAADFPIEILKVGVRWQSTFGGSPSGIEQGLHIYAGGLPDPGSPIFALPGPTLNDGVMNVFDLEPLPGKILVGGGPITVTVEFLNDTSGMSPFVPSVAYDGDGCQPGKNAVLAMPGGWNDACPLGVTGDFIFELEYRRANCRAAGMLTVDKTLTSNLQLAWAASCIGSDTDYAIYEGIIGTWPSHARVTCTTFGNVRASIAPSMGNTYYLVVPNDGSTEGTYGTDSTGAERSQGTMQCETQQTCP